MLFRHAFLPVPSRLKTTRLLLTTHPLIPLVGLTVPGQPIELLNTHTPGHVCAEYCMANRPARRPRRCRHYLSFQLQIIKHPRVSVSRECGAKSRICTLGPHPSRLKPTRLPRTCPDPVGASVGARHGPVSTPLDLLPIDLRFNLWIHPLWPLPSS